MKEKPILAIEKVSKDFEGVHALVDINWELENGKINGLIGPNGSGKTTLFNLISGTLPVSGGKITFQSEDITHLKPDVISKKGIARTFQGGQVVPSMTCLENAMCGAYGATRADVLKTFFRIPFTKSVQEEETREHAFKFLKMVGLEGMVHRWTNELVWVQRQLLQIARALASQPKLLMLDEPTAGMGPGESSQVEKIIRQAQEMGITIILVSHDVKLVTAISDWIIVLNSGEKIAEGSSEQIRHDPKVMEAYLGAD